MTAPHTFTIIDGCLPELNTLNPDARRHTGLAAPSKS